MMGARAVLLLGAASSLLRASSSGGPGDPPAPTHAHAGSSFTVGVDWASPALTTASTAATVEVDCCEPFLTRDPEAHRDGGGPFAPYMVAMQDLGADFVRWAPWYPKVVVLELRPPDCTATKPATNWNSSAFDAVTADFMQAVCGPLALEGQCEHSVAIQLATSPSWVWVNGTDPDTLPDDPWIPVGHGVGTYNAGTALKDESCKPMAEYFARVVSHYTAGGHHDSCGHWHPSGFHYNWSIVSFFNENEHAIGGERYTRCWDQLRPLLEKISPQTRLEGPETGGGIPASYKDFIDPASHTDHRAPELYSFHVDGGGGSPDEYDQAIAAVDSIVSSWVDPIVAQRDKVAPETELVINEWIFFIRDWCDPEDARRLFATHADLESDSRSAGAAQCPNWADPRANGSAVGINRKSLGWSASAAHFAYGYGRLALAGFRYIGLDDLACGPYPDNEPAVTGMDWQTGEPNARFFVVKMLISALGSGPKALLHANVTQTGSAPPALPKAGQIGTGFCDHTAPGGDCDSDAKGSVDTSSWPSNGSLAACVANVSDCTRANYVSFSAANHDCSWFASCDFADLQPSDAGYRTEHDHAPYSKGQRGLLLVNKVHTAATVTLDATMVGGVATVLQGIGAEPGFTVPSVRLIAADRRLSLGPYGVATVMAGSGSDTPAELRHGVKHDDDARASPTPFDPPLMLWDGDHMRTAREQIAQGTASAALRAAVTALNTTAFQSLPEYDPGPLRPSYYSVMNKSQVPPSGDKHDFLVYASYYWPCNAVCGVDAPPPPGDHCERFFTNVCRAQGDHCQAGAAPCDNSNCSGSCGAPAGLCPDYCNNGSMFLHPSEEYTWCRPCDNKRDKDGKPIGEPWAGHDGYNWPGAEIDRASIDNVWGYVVPLSLGWWFGCGASTCESHHEQRYLERAAEIWRYWFINPDTAMNPNLNWSDIYPGQPSGGIGGVVHVDRLKLGLDAIRLIEAGDTEMKVWTKQDRAAMRRWVTKFLDWWLNSELGQQARYNPDNIGISYQLNAMAMAFYLNNMSLAHDVALADSRFRYDNEIDTKGRVYRELGDSGSFAYTVGTMSSFMLLARASKIAGLDLYTYSNSSTGYGDLQHSLEWMAPFCAKGGACGNASNFKTPQAQAKCIGWPYPAVDYSPLNECKIIYGLAALAYQNQTYAAAASSAPDQPYDWWLGAKDLGIGELMTLLYPPFTA